MTEGAKQDVVLRSTQQLDVLGQRGRKFRFPGFFGSGFDWPPDYDGPGNMANTLQEMLVQPGVGGTILLFPAWPKDWDVDFKLHAPHNTIIEGVYRAGKLEQLQVVPEARRKDILISQCN